MRNAILSILLFIFTMFCVLLLNNSVNKLCDDIKFQAEDIEIDLRNDDLELAYSKSIKLLESIEEKNLVTSIYLNHQEFDNLLNEAVKLSTYIIHEDKTEAHASLHLLKHNTVHIKTLQMPIFKNIL